MICVGCLLLAMWSILECVGCLLLGMWSTLKCGLYQGGSTGENLFFLYKRCQISEMASSTQCVLQWLKSPKEITLSLSAWWREVTRIYFIKCLTELQPETKLQICMKLWRLFVFLGFSSAILILFYLYLDLAYLDVWWRKILILTLVPLGPYTAALSCFLWLCLSTLPPSFSLALSF